MEIRELVEFSHKTAKEKGWWDEDRSIGDILTNVHAEVSEAWEEYRKGKLLDEVYFCEGKPEGFPVEIADIFIRLADLCGRYRIDLEGVIALKMAYNRERTYRHGGKLA